MEKDIREFGVPAVDKPEVLEPTEPTESMSENAADKAPLQANSRTFASVAQPSELSSSEKPVSKCADKYYLPLLGLILCFVGFGVYGVCCGNIDLIRYPFDSSGNQCGRPDSVTSDFNYVYFVDPKNFSDYTVCVKDCGNPSNCYSNDWVTDCSFTIVMKDQLSLETIDPYRAYGLLYYCIPMDLTVFSEDVDSRINVSGFPKMIDDIMKIKCLALGLLVPGLILIILTVFLLSCWPKCLYIMMGVAVLGTIGFAVIIGIYIDKFPYAVETGWLIASIVVGSIITLVFSVTLWCYRESIGKAIEYAHITANLLSDILDFLSKSIKNKYMKSSMIFLICLIVIGYVLFVIVLFAVLVVFLVYLYACRTIPEEEFYSVFGNATWDLSAKVFFWLELCLIFPYVIFFVTNLFSLRFAVVYRNYYFGEEYMKGKKTPQYLGAVAGSALGAYFTKPMFFLSKMHQLLLSGLSFIPFASVGLNWLGSHFQFYGENTLYEVAHSYLSLADSAKNVQRLFYDSDLDLSGIVGIGWYIGFLGKICFTILFMLIGYIFVLLLYLDEMWSPLGPILVFFIEGVAIAILSTGFFEMTCNCSLICYLHDDVSAQRSECVQKLKEFIKKYSNEKSNECTCKCRWCENCRKATPLLLN